MNMHFFIPDFPIPHIRLVKWYGPYSLSFSLHKFKYYLILITSNRCWNYNFRVEPCYSPTTVTGAGNNTFQHFWFEPIKCRIQLEQWKFNLFTREAMMNTALTFQFHNLSVLITCNLHVDSYFTDWAHVRLQNCLSFSLVLEILQPRSQGLSDPENDEVGDIDAWH